MKESPSLVRDDSWVEVLHDVSTLNWSKAYARGAAVCLPVIAG